MKLRTSRTLVAGYFAAMLVAVTWPGVLPFARIRPLILGLPFSFAWIALWVLGSVLVLWGADRIEARHRRAGRGAAGSGAARAAGGDHARPGAADDPGPGGGEAAS